MRTVRCSGRLIVGCQPGGEVSAQGVFAQGVSAQGVSAKGVSA